MKLTDLKIRTKMICRMSETEGTEFVIRIEDIYDDETFLTDLPIVTSGPIRFRAETKLDFIIPHDEGIYYFRGVVKPQNKVSDYMLIKKLGYEINKLQRREFFRIEMKGLYSLSTYKSFFEEDFKFYDFSIINISAGGIKINTDFEFKKFDDLVFFDISLGEEVDGIWGRHLKSCEADPEKDQFKYISTFKFLYLNDKEINSIIRYLFSKQREYIKLKRD